MTAADLVIEILADSEAELKEANKQLVALIADLSVENALLREVLEGLYETLRRKLHEQAA